MNTTVIFLLLTLVMPRELPDKNYKLRMDTMDQCEVEMKAFLDNGITKAMEKDGVIAIGGGCFTDKKKGEGET